MATDHFARQHSGIGEEDFRGALLDFKIIFTYARKLYAEGVVSDHLDLGDKGKTGFPKGRGGAWDNCFSQGLSKTDIIHSSHYRSSAAASQACLPGGIVDERLPDDWVGGCANHYSPYALASRMHVLQPSRPR